MINYDILIPNTDDNVVYIKDKDFNIHEISKINIDYRWHNASYWFSLRININDKHSQVLLKKNESLQTILILGEHRFEIHGEMTILNITQNKSHGFIEYDCMYLVKNTKDVVNHPRQTLRVKRTDLIDLENL